MLTLTNGPTGNLDVPSRRRHSDAIASFRAFPINPEAFIRPFDGIVVSAHIMIFSRSAKTLLTCELTVFSLHLHALPGKQEEVHY